MKSYFLCLFASALLSGAVCMAAEGSGFEKHIRYVCALVCIVVTVSPIVNITIETPELPSYEEASIPSGTDAVISTAEEQAREYISSLIMKKFGISCKGVRIDLYSEGDSVTVTNVRVYVDGGDTAAVRRYLEETLGGAIEVEYDGAV